MGAKDAEKVATSARAWMKACILLNNCRIKGAEKVVQGG